MLLLSLLLLAPARAGRPGSAGSVDGPRGLVRCHWSAAGGEDLCPDVAVWAEDAWAAQVEGLGFNAPPPDGGLGGSDALDVYLADAGGRGSAWVDCDGGDPHCVDTDPGDGWAAASSYVVIDYRTAIEDLPHFVHHEFQHTTQYAADFAEPFLSLWEGTAVAAERWTDPGWTTSADDLADYQATPWVSAVLQDGYFLDEAYGLWSWYEYGAVAWIWWMDEQFGDGAGGVGPALWAAAAQEGRGSEPDVLDAWAALAGGEWQASMLDFALARARMGTDAGLAATSFAGAQAYAWREAELDASAEVSFTPEFPPFPLGTTYLDVAWAGGDVEVRLAGDPSVRWGLVWTAPGGEGEAVEGAAVTLRGGQATVGVVNLGPASMDADDPLSTASFTLTLTPVEEEGEEEAKDRGCSAAPGRGGLAALLAITMVSRRRLNRPTTPPAAPPRPAGSTSPRSPRA